MKLYFLDYSTPKIVVSDKSSAFKSKDFSKFSENHNFQHIIVATPCSKSNGQIEYYNRTLIPLLAELVEITSVN